MVSLDGQIHSVHDSSTGRIAEQGFSRGNTDFVLSLGGAVYAGKGGGMNISFNLSEFQRLRPPIPWAWGWDHVNFR